MANKLNCKTITKQIGQYKQWLAEINQSISEGDITRAQELLDLCEKATSEDLIFINVREVFAQKHNLRYVGTFHSGYARAKRFNRGSDFFVDRDGKILSSKLIVDRDGKTLIKEDYHRAGIFSEGLAKVQKSDDKWYFIDETGQTITPTGFDNADDFHDGVAIVTDGSSEEIKQKLIDKHGRILTEEGYDSIGYFHDGWANVTSKFKGNFIDKNGNLLSDKWFENFISSFNEGFAPVEQDNQCFYIDKTGKPVIRVDADFVDTFRYGFARIKKGRNWFYIDHQGEKITEQGFDYASDFFGDQAIVGNLGEDRQNTEWFLLDKTGQSKNIGKYKSVYPLNDKIIIAEKGTRKWLLDSNGDTLVELAGDKDDKPMIYTFSDKIVKFKNNEGYGLMNLDGTILFKGCHRIGPIEDGIATIEDEIWQEIYVDSEGTRRF